MIRLIIIIGTLSLPHIAYSQLEISEDRMVCDYVLSDSLVLKMLLIDEHVGQDSVFILTTKAVTSWRNYAALSRTARMSQCIPAKLCDVGNISFFLISMPRHWYFCQGGKSSTAFVIYQTKRISDQYRVSMYTHSLTEERLPGFRYVKLKFTYVFSNNAWTLKKSKLKKVRFVNLIKI